MTLDEAIKERQKVIEVQEKLYKEASTNESKEIIKSATDNDRQFVEWLRELKDLREENKVLTRDCLRLIKSNDKLRKKVGVIAKYKRLLKVAVEDMTGMQFGNECKVCSKNLLPNECPIHNNVACILEKDFKWRYADEALKLIGDE